MKIDVEGLEFSYNGVLTLKNMNLTVKKGEFLSIIGPNGSGKTTFLKCINRILNPEKGSIMINEFDLDKLHRKDIAKQVGYIPQAEKGAFPTTVFDTVLMGRKPHINWVPTSRDLNIVVDVMEMLDLSQISMKNINELSGGQRQKVIIARALAQQPEILLLDEPTSSLDLKHQLEVLDITRAQADNDVTVIMSVHDLNLAARYSDKIIMMKDGEIFHGGGPEILTPENIEPVYGVSVDVYRTGDQIWILPKKLKKAPGLKVDKNECTDYRLRDQRVPGTC
ncbi:ABC transporter related protein [Methanosalsum zhilinae DSM 4017]|uniref:Cobalamin import ATP-binding protein BtuD n=1 Tax=Methanosalsum zhilinae (strain DSM 4017 / NBRC 107636 / OCM 62 / WeN5) TaxID=679901 RepID=F7XLL4_METZD|nr:ABC transporter ATP-binding protein [Methanosalsum zhilinae]AEH60833.1 ABC transporter related protein [Methanosalsum zhilinae DSM 4017]